MAHYDDDCLPPNRHQKGKHESGLRSALLPIYRFLHWLWSAWLSLVQLILPDISVSLPSPIASIPASALLDEHNISHWTLALTADIPETRDTTFPTFNVSKIKALVPGTNIWDTWRVLDEDGKVARIHGHFHVIVALGEAPTPQQTRLVYFYADCDVDDQRFVYGGLLFSEGLVQDAQEWSGCTIWRHETLQTFYTLAVPERRKGVSGFQQKIATSVQNVRMLPDERDTHHPQLTLERPFLHHVILEGDGQLYQTFQQMTEEEQKRPNRHSAATGNSKDNNYCFRDPTFFRDPADGRTYLLFEGNTGASVCPEGSIQAAYLSDETCSTQGFHPTVDQLKANGCIGIATLSGEHYTQTQLMPPLLTSNLVSDEIERINMVYRQGRYYLYFIARGSMMATTRPDIINRNFLIGFCSSTLFGRYTPLNGNGIVIQQRSTLGAEKDDQYVYSWLVLADGRVLTYACHANDEKGGTRLNLTAGPTATLDIRGDRTRVTGLLYDINPKQF